jgi:hypothetical protein
VILNIVQHTNKQMESTRNVIQAQEMSFKRNEEETGAEEKVGNCGQAC